MNSEKLPTLLEMNACLKVGLMVQIYRPLIKAIELLDIPKPVRRTMNLTLSSMTLEIPEWALYLHLQ
jgi:hypothetical protein